MGVKVPFYGHLKVHPPLTPSRQGRGKRVLQEADVKSLYQAERAKAYFWEYSYLNYYLVSKTQFTLDWLASCTSPVSISLYDSITSSTVSDPKERQAILNALERHYLIFIENDLIKVSEKGREYIKWRGNVHQPPHH